MILVNFGCGEIFHRNWVNLDFSPCAPGILKFDASAKLPFANGSVDVVYHAHLLEHLDSFAADAFIAECFRVLRPGGVLRVVVPDLEGIVQSYLRELASVRRGEDETLYEWSRLELLDQAARSRSGGRMLDFLSQLTPAQIERVRTRVGTETDGILAMRVPRLRKYNLGMVSRRMRRELARAFLFALGGSRMRAAFDEGWFRQNGEVHRVMYDEISLVKLLVNRGFSDPQKTTATESRIAGYAAYELDAVGGVPRKPDSLYLEASRPSSGG